jgi:hypothetical protein
MIGALCLLPAVALGQDDPLVSDRPDFTESAVTITPGRFQIEAGVTHGEADGAETTAFGEFLLRIGVAAHTEIRLGLGSWLQEAGDRDGAANPTLGLKQRFLRGEGARPDFAVIALTTVPLGSDEVASSQAEPAVVGAAQWDLGETIGLGVNLGWSSLHDAARDEHFSSAWLSASLGLAASDRGGLFLEGFGFDGEEPGGGNTGYLDAGATYALGPDLQLDARYGRGLNGRDDEWFAGAGFVVRR